jgi:ubiquinone biosynthesis protein Coq4
MKTLLALPAARVRAWLSVLVRPVRAFGSGARLLVDPSRLDDVFAFDRAMTGARALRRLAEAARRDPRGRRALVERPRLVLPALGELAGLPSETLGRAYADYLARHRVDPAALPIEAADDELAFVRAHLYETHDVWHVVTGFGTDVAGELGLQAFYRAQLPGRLAESIVIGGLVNAVLFDRSAWRPRVRAIVRGWLLGRRARALFGVRWSALWSAPLADVRATLGVEVTAVDRLLGP